MAILNIRNLDPEVHKALRLRAAKAGRSMEAEAREIIAAACARDKARVTVEDLQAMVDDMYGGKKPKSAVDDLIRERRREARHEWSR